MSGSLIRNNYHQMYRNFCGVLKPFCIYRKECEEKGWPIDEEFRKNTTIQLPGTTPDYNDQRSGCNFYKYCTDLAAGNALYIIGGVLVCTARPIQKTSGLVKGNIKLHITEPVPVPDLSHEDAAAAYSCILLYGTAETEVIHNTWVNAFITNPPPAPPPAQFRQEDPFEQAVRELMEQYLTVQ